MRLRSPGQILTDVGNSPLTLFGVAVGVAAAVILWVAIAHVNSRVDHITDRVTIIERKDAAQASADEKAKAVTCDPAHPSSKACKSLKKALGSLTPAQRKTLHDHGKVVTRSKSKNHTTTQTITVTPRAPTKTTPKPQTKTQAQAPAPSSPSPSTGSRGSSGGSSGGSTTTTSKSPVSVTPPTVKVDPPKVTATTPGIGVQVGPLTTTVPAVTVQVDPQQPVQSVQQTVTNATNAVGQTVDGLLKP